MTQDAYQRDLSLASPILLDRNHKRPKVEKMLAILEAAGMISDTAHGGLAIDVGCSRGFFTEGVAPHFQMVVGLDIDGHALRIALGERRYDNLFYIAGDSLHLPLRNNSVRLVVCNHVYEHVPSAERLFAEIERVLTPDGACYLGAASRLTIREPHYHLPFLSWLPKPAAHLYMRVCGKGTHYYENLRTYWGLRNLISRFRAEDFTLAVLTSPDRYKARDMIPRGGWMEKVPRWVWRLVYPLLPSYIFILRKREGVLAQ